MALELLEALVRSLWQRELASDLATLSRIPSGDMRWFVDRFRAMSDSDRVDLVGALCKQSTCMLAGLPFADWPTSERETNVLCRLQEERGLTRWSHWKYLSLRMLKTDLTLSGNAGEMAIGISESEAERIQGTVTAKAPQLRKAVKTVLRERGYVQTSNQASNWTWSYGGENGFDVWFDFGGMDNQLRYEVGPSSTRDSPLFRCRLGFEGVLGLLGFGRLDGNWNIIAFEQIDDISHLVVGLIDELVSFFEQAEPALRAAA